MEGRAELTVANVVWSDELDLVHFLPLHEYLFGTSHFRAGNPERGAYNRDFILVPIFDRQAVDPAAIGCNTRPPKRV